MIPFMQILHSVTWLFKLQLYHFSCYIWLEFLIVLLFVDVKFFLPSTLNGKGLKFLPQLSSANYFVNMSNYHDGIRNYKKGYADICF